MEKNEAFRYFNEYQFNCWQHVFLIPDDILKYSTWYSLRFIVVFIIKAFNFEKSSAQYVGDPDSWHSFELVLLLIGS